MSKSNTTVTDLLNKGKKTKSSKSKIEVINDSSFHTEVDDYIDKNRAFKNAKVSMEVAEQAILEKSGEWYSNQKGEANSVKFAGNNGTITATYKDAFLKINEEISNELKDDLGNTFDVYFEEKRNIKLNKTDDETIELLMKTLGETKFLEIFDIEVSTITVSEMDRKQFELPESSRNLIKQYKAAMKVS